MVETITLREYFDAMLAADRRFDDERDRRYSEVAAARAEALKIKESGDAKALELAREIQTYKDEKANELREQINQERGLYATKAEIAPLTAYVLSEQGRFKGVGSVGGIVMAVLGLLAMVGSLAVNILRH